MRLIYIALAIFPLLTSAIWAEDKGQPVRKPVPAKEKAAKEKAAKERAAKKPSEGKAAREKAAKKKR